MSHGARSRPETTQSTGIPTFAVGAVLFLLGRPGPSGLPDGLRFASPAVAWRIGLRHYRFTGS